MRKYESIVVFHPHLDTTKLVEEVEKITKFVETNRGQDIQIDNWGKKELPYLVKKQKNGYFVCFNYESENNNLPSKLASSLKLNEIVIKYQTHRIVEKNRKFQGNPARIGEEQEEFNAY
jgi:small subunit ribosomal protein S6